MSEWRSITAAARRAGALLVRDRAAGEAEFARLLKRYPRDGMVLLERGRARVVAGDPENARADLEAAINHLPLQRYQDDAGRELALLRRTQAPAADPAGGSVRTIAVPSAADLQRAHSIFTEKEQRAVDFEVAARLLDQALGAPERLSPTVPTAMLLQSWNSAYYQDGRVFDRAHFEQLDAVLETLRHPLMLLRRRHLASFEAADESTVTALFDGLLTVVGRVGAAKVLHLWAPSFFPMWDTRIAAAYGFDLSRPGAQYLSYVRVVRSQIERLLPPAGVQPLKALDEYNYCVFTKQWLSV